jgi:hypothetical protein
VSSQLSKKRSIASQTSEGIERSVRIASAAKRASVRLGKETKSNWVRPMLSSNRVVRATIGTATAHFDLSITQR